MPPPRIRATRRGMIAIIIGLAYFAFRLPGLFDRPVFTDESVYARWTQLIGAHPWDNLWVSLADAKFPLHYWLLALFRPLAADSIAAGRLLSVCVGAVTLVFLPRLVDALGSLMPDRRSSAAIAGLIACGLVITSPLFALLQRLILAEPLLLLEMVLIAWLSLRLARCANASTDRAAAWKVAVALGVIWGLALLTKQVFSFLFWGLPPLALLVYPRTKRRVAVLRRFVPLFAVATIIGLAMFIPALFAPTSYGLRELLLYKPSFHRVTGVSRVSAIAENVGQLLLPRANGAFYWWPYDAARPLDHAYLYIYCTPPILLLILVAIVWLIGKRQWRMLVFLGGWSAAMLAPLILGSNSHQLFSRFLAVGVLPLLLIVAWSAAVFLDWLRGRFPAHASWMAPAGITLLLLWPGIAVAWSNANWKAPTLPAADVDQYISGYSGGYSTRTAIAWLNEQAAHQPITLITGSWFLAPNDLLWLELSGNPNIRMYWYEYKDTVPVPLAGQPCTFMLGESLRASNQTHPMTLDPARPVIFIAPAMRQPHRDTVNSFIPMQQLPAGTTPLMSFPNPSWNDSLPIMELLVVQIPLPMRSASGPHAP